MPSYISVLITPPYDNRPLLLKTEKGFIKIFSFQKFHSRGSDFFSFDELKTQTLSASMAYTINFLQL